MLIARNARGLACDRRPYALKFDDGEKVTAKTVVIATGAQYRKLSLENLERFEGAGVYYGATHLESQLCGGEDVVVVGGGNSAGQAAVFMAQTARHVYMLVRSEGLAQTMYQKELVCANLIRTDLDNQAWPLSFKIQSQDTSILNSPVTTRPPGRI